MSYSQIFGGATLYPSQQTYLSLTITTNITLAWPIEQQIGGDIVADIIDVDAGAIGLIISLSDATTVSNGIQSVFTNIGSNDFTVNDASGGTILSIQPGEAWVTYLTDNTSVGGTWRNFQLGATVSVAQASALAGAGLKATSNTLNQTMVPRTEAFSPITVVDEDRADAIIYTGGGGDVDLPSPTTVGSDWFFMLRNSGTGDLKVTPPGGVIDGGTDITLTPASSTIIFCNGTDFFTIGFTVATGANFDFVPIDLTNQSGTFALLANQLNRISYRFSGIMAGNVAIVVPNTFQEYWCDNQTTGGDLTIGTSGQASPVNLATGTTLICSCDASNVINAASGSAFAIPLPISEGGTNAITEAAARTNLQVPPDSRALTAGAGLTGGGDLTADRTFDIGLVGIGILVNADSIELNTASTLNVDHATVQILAGAGCIGGGTLEATRTIDVGGSNGIFITPSDVQLDFTNDRNVDHSAVTLTAGNGLTGGGDITANRSFTVEVLAAGGIDVGVTGLDLDVPGLVSTSAPLLTNELILDVGGLNRRVTLGDAVDAAWEITFDSAFVPTWLLADFTGGVVPIGTFTWVKFVQPSTGLGFVRIYSNQDGNTYTENSDSTTMSWAAIPITIRPLDDRTAITQLTDAGVGRQLGNVVINAGSGTIFFELWDDVSSPSRFDIAGGFTNDNLQKGISTGVNFDISYSL